MDLNPFYIALDTASEKEIQRWVEFALEKEIGVKVGLQAFSHFGPPLIRDVVGRGLSVILDLKLHDIPTTVLKTIEVINRLGVAGYTLHAQNGEEVWKKIASKKSPVAFAVTVLTSLEGKELSQMGISLSVETYAQKLVQRLLEFGQQSFVCAPNDRQALRGILGNRQSQAWFLCPGIRLDSDSQDQKRVGGWGEVKDSARTSFVLGRTLTENPDPSNLIDRLLDTYRS